MKGADPVIGFTFLRNGVRYDYPFRETLECLALVSDHVVIALGDSDDGTNEIVKNLKLRVPLTIVESAWDESSRKSGLELSRQTNIALAAARTIAPKGWAFYLQCDELILDTEAARYRQELARAAAENYAALRFRYLHFWRSADKLAIGKRWYPAEIRAIRLEAAWESYGDAQSFRLPANPSVASAEKVICETDLEIYHYGHVREPAAYERKVREFHRWWHNDDSLAAQLKKGDRLEAREICVPFYGPHPKIVAERLDRLTPAWRGEIAPELLIFGRKSDFAADWLARVAAKHIFFTESVADFIKHPGAKVVLAAWPLWAFWAYPWQPGHRLPRRMGSPQAKPWTARFQHERALASIGIGIRAE